MIQYKLSVNALAARSGSIFRKFSERFSQSAEPICTGLYNLALREDGLLPGTMVATAYGWVNVDQIQQGDEVMTFDHGLQPVIENRKLVLDLGTVPNHKSFVMHIPVGAIGNRVEMQLLPRQEVIIESDKAEELLGDPFLLIPSLLLDGYNGISKRPVEGKLRFSLLIFEEQQVVQTDGGALTRAHTHGCFSPLSKDAPMSRDFYMGMSPQKLLELVDWPADALKALPDHPVYPKPSQKEGPFGGQSVEDSYAAVASRLQ